jgi:hypothetical protein
MVGPLMLGRRGLAGLAFILLLWVGSSGPGATAQQGAPPSGRVEFKAGSHIPSQFTVPADVGYVTVTVRGNAGGIDDKTAAPGRGALITATLPVTPGQVLDVYVADNESGYGHGGSHGTVPGASSAHSGAGGGGASAIVANGAPLIVAGGGGGGGGAGNHSGDSSQGGPGGDAGSPTAWPGAPGLEGNSPNENNLDGGCGGCEHSTHGGEGDSVEKEVAFVPAGGGGGGGGGVKGGAGGDDGWTGSISQDNAIGGSGGGGGSSFVVPDALDVSFLHANTCTHRSAPGCRGDVVITWGGQPKSVLVQSGNGQSTPADGDFGPLAAIVVDDEGIPLSGETVTFTAPSEGASGLFPGGRTSVTATTAPDGIATVSGPAANGISGEWDLTASVAGVPDPALFTLTNTPIVTRTTIESSQDPSPVTKPPSFKATVRAGSDGPPAGAVEFAVDGVPLAPAVPLDASGTATLDASRVPPLAPGTHVVSARYLGDQGHAQSTGRLQQRVTATPTATALAVEPNPSQLGASVTLRASVSAPDAGASVPTGTVTFRTGGTDLGDVELDGNGVAELVTTALPLGSDDLEAEYAGDSNFAASTGTAVASVGTDVTATQLSADTDPIGFGHPLTVRAAVRSEGGPVAGGTVDFSVDGTAACTAVPLDGGAAACTLPVTLSAGTHDVRAVFVPAAGSGDDPSLALLRVVVTPARTTTAVSVEPLPAIFGEALTLRASVQADAAGIDLGAGTVQFAVDGDPVGDPVGLVDGVAQLPAPCSGSGVPVGLPCPLENGPHVVEATFTPAGVDVTGSRGVTIARVAPEATTTSVKPSGNPVMVGDALTLSAAVATADPTGLAGDVQFLVDGKVLGAPVAVRAGKATSQPVATLSVGRHAVDARYLGFGSFDSSEAGASVQVVARPKPPPPPPPPPGPRLRVQQGRVTATAQGTLVLRGTCGGGPGRCEGLLSLRLGRALRAGRGRVRDSAELGRRTVSMASGSSVRLLMDLNATGERLLRTHPSFRAAWQPTAAIEGSPLRVAGSPAREMQVRGPLRVKRHGKGALTLHCARRGPDHQRHCFGTVSVRKGGKTVAARPVRMRRGETRAFALALGRGARGADRLRVRLFSDIPVGRPRTSIHTVRVTR